MTRAEFMPRRNCLGWEVEVTETLNLSGKLTLLLYHLHTRFPEILGPLAQDMLTNGKSYTN